MRKAVREVPLSRPWMGEREEELVLDVLRSGRMSLGPAIDRFEEMFSERLGAPCVAVSSGTAGLHLLAHYYGLGPGDEVITSPYSFVASSNCFIYDGETPVWEGGMRHPRLGLNCQIDDIGAALGIAQLERLDEILERRSAAGDRYEELLATVHGVHTLYPGDADHRRSWFVYVVKLAE